eukprot:TRINITY_DN1975_c0_g1_i1.p1 TRINITY_DN1975_c0_g1~~TRINITY_DN1975_c0_g1_i1.p1  ORF type:complete len:298 (-),score=51.37 TRINITY_DN1975_c0_g1_i1:344-1237(-)
MSSGSEEVDWLDWFFHDDGFVPALREAYETHENAPFFSPEYVRYESKFVPVLLILAVVIFVVRLQLDKIVDSLIRMGHFILTNEEDTLKLKECVFYTAYYAFVVSTGTLVFVADDWSMSPPANMFKGYPMQPFVPFVRLYMLFELAFYLHALTYTLLFDFRRSDWLQFVIHHIATLFLAGSAYYFRQQRIGVFILLMHNVSDVFLYSAKIFKYLGYNLPTDILFVFFAVSFLICRLIVLPYTGLYSTLVEAEFLAFFETNHVLFTVLMGLHIFWFGLIIKIARKKFVKGGTVEDCRE